MIHIEVVWLGRTELGRGLKLGFEVIGGEIAEGRMPALGVVIGEIMADFQPRFREIAEAAAVE